MSLHQSVVGHAGEIWDEISAEFEAEMDQLGESRDEVRALMRQAAVVALEIPVLRLAGQDTTLTEAALSSVFASLKARVSIELADAFKMSLFSAINKVIDQARTILVSVIIAAI